jgi:hypothetical protein
VTPVIATVAPALDLRPAAAIPSLDELRGHDDLFFRRGRTGSHQDELPAESHHLFWSRIDNQAAMALLGYPPPDGDQARSW